MKTEELKAELERAELELFEWSTGKRSCLNELMSVENCDSIGSVDRQQTLVRVAQADAAEIWAAANRVIGLRLLVGPERGQQ